MSTRVPEEPSVIEVAVGEILAGVQQYVAQTGLIVLALTIGFLALFAVHSLTFWLSGNPETAFHIGRNAIGVTSTVWNTGRTVYNAGLDVISPAVPVMNLMSKHVTEPIIWTAIDVISLIFTGGKFKGIISEDTLPFEGHKCNSKIDPGSAKFCTEADAYTKQLGVGKAEQSNVINNGSTILLSTGTARRLQALTTGASVLSGQSLIGALPVQPLVDAVDEIAGMLVTIGAQVFDIGMHVVYTVLSELAITVFNLLQLLVRSIAGLAMQIVQSGMLQNIIKLGLDLLVVLVIHIAMPLLFAMMDLVFCLVDLLSPAGYAKQLQCVSEVCFTESGDVGAPVCPPCDVCVCACMCMKGADGRDKCCYTDNATGTWR